MYIVAIIASAIIIAQTIVFALVISWMERGRARLIDALVAKSASEYYILGRDDKPTQERRRNPVIDDEFEAYVASKRARADLLEATEVF